VNQLIADLPRSERKALMRHCTPVDLAFGEVLCTQHGRYTHAYFPSTACISLTATVAGHPSMALGMIGHEGMLGVSLVLALDLAPYKAVVQGPGTALRITKRMLHGVLSDSPVLLKSMQRYLFRLRSQVAQTAVCTRFHVVEARLARWLLMTDDRTQADHFHLTHQFLADMLGVQRSAVTIASGVLKRGRLISYSRGTISILDRTGLEAAACECYAADQSG
jgi:CRP-like cAMP-binding protein